MVVAVIGGIGSGKSLVMKVLGEQGFTLLYADKIALNMEEEGGAAYEGLTAEFGGSILRGTGIDKEKLAALIYSDPAIREKVNAIVHPPVTAYIRDYIEGHPDENIAVETALPWDELREEADLMIFVRAPEEARYRRLEESRGMGAKRAQSIMSAQRSDEEYTSLADIVIDNSRDEESLRESVRELVTWT